MKSSAVAAMAVDGSAIEAILDLAGAPKKSSPKTVNAIEAALGKSLAIETRKFLERAVTLSHPDANLGFDFFGALPNVPKWIDELANDRRGFLQCVQHFLGLYPIGEQLQYGDTMIALVVLEPYGKGSSLGGVMYYDEREVGTWGASISAFLLQSLAKYCEEAGGDGDPRDCFVFEKVDASKPPPAAAKLPAPIAKAWEAHWRWRLERCSRWWIAQFLRGDDPKRFLRALPTEKIWTAEKAGVSATHHEGMYWLLAHWLLGNEKELAEALTLAKKNSSKLVAALAAHVSKNAPSAKAKKSLDALLVQVRTSMVL